MVFILIIGVNNILRLTVLPFFCMGDLLRSMLRKGELFVLRRLQLPLRLYFRCLNDGNTLRPKF